MWRAPGSVGDKAAKAITTVAGHRWIQRSARLPQPCAKVSIVCNFVACNPMASSCVRTSVK